MHLPMDFHCGADDLERLSVRLMQHATRQYKQRAVAATPLNAPESPNPRRGCALRLQFLLREEALPRAKTASDPRWASPSATDSRETVS
jgi:hypothetical protein